MTDQPERILRLKPVIERTGLSRSTLYRKVADGTFPRPIQLSARCIGWRETAVNAWMDNPMVYGISPST